MAQKIVIVDDDKDFLEIFSTKLTAAGFEVTTATGGKSGIKTVEDVLPDLILLDVEMPDMNGVEVLMKLKSTEDTQSIKVAFLTNYGEPQKDASWIDEKFARNSGAVDYIKKSDDLDKVVAEVKRLLTSDSE